MKPLAEQNLYEILEVPTDAPEDAIVKAWDRVSALCAPGALATYTLLAKDDANLLGQRLEEALSVLLDPVARQRYDESLSLTPVPRGGGCAGASASGPEPVSHPRALPPVIRARTLPPIIPPLREVPPMQDRPVEAPIALDHVAPAAPAALAPAAEAGGEAGVVQDSVAVAAADAPAADAPPPAEEAPRAPGTTEAQLPADAPGAPIPLATLAPVSPPFAAVAEPPAPTPVPLVTPAPEPPPAALPPPQELLVGDGTRFTGDVLRRAREARGITLQQFCERTKITRLHVENLEADRYERLPAVVYLRGILMAMAKELRLDGQKVARSYLEAMAAASADGQPARVTQR